MRFIGIDPSSTKVGICVVEGSQVLFRGTWDVRGHKGKWQDDELPGKLYEYGVRLLDLIHAYGPVAAGIEKISVTQNMDTVRKIAYFESASMLACHEGGVKVIPCRTTHARKVVLGKTMKKEQALEKLEGMVGFSLTPDEADALTFAWCAQSEYRELAGAATPSPQGYS